MIKNLKIRFVTISMIILSLIMLTSFGGIYLVMYKSEVNMSEEIMNTLLENHKKNIPDAEKKIKFPPPQELDKKYDGNIMRSHIFVELGKNNEILNVSYQYFFQNEDSEEKDYKEEIKNIINIISSSGNVSGKYTIDSVQYRYKLLRQYNHREDFLIILDRSIEISTLKRLGFTFIIIGCTGLIVFFFISHILASWAIKPIEKAWNRQKQFIADASHELKTPLTVISANTDVVLSTPNETIKNQERWLQHIKSETTRMSKLVNELLYIAKSDANEIKMEMSDFDISNTVSSVCLMFESLIFEADRSLVSDITSKIIYFGDEDRIKQLVTILLDNALKYSLKNTEISLSLSKNNQGKIRLCLSNKCEPLTDENISKLFDRFYRVDKSRNSSTGGNGLGLNIAQTITEAHKGNISVQYNYEMISFIVLL